EGGRSRARAGGGARQGDDPPGTRRDGRCPDTRKSAVKRAPLNKALPFFAAGLFVATAHAQLAVSGRPVPGMTAFDATMTNFMNANGITAGVLGISRNGRIEYLRAFGWLVAPAGGAPGVPLPENTMMRTASAVKPVTAAAVRQLAADGGFGATGLN